MGQRFDRGGADGLDGWDGPQVRLGTTALPCLLFPLPVLTLVFKRVKLVPTVCQELMELDTELMDIVRNARNHRPGLKVLTPRFFHISDFLSSL